MVGIDTEDLTSVLFAYLSLGLIAARLCLKPKFPNATARKTRPVASKVDAQKVQLLNHQLVPF